MAEEGSKGLGLESWLLVALIITVLMSTIFVPIILTSSIIGGGNAYECVGC